MRRHEPNRRVNGRGGRRRDGGRGRYCRVDQVELGVQVDEPSSLHLAARGEVSDMHRFPRQRVKPRPAVEELAQRVPPLPRHTALLLLGLFLQSIGRTLHVRRSNIPSPIRKVGRVYRCEAVAADMAGAVRREARARAQARAQA